ncbi:uncharacterized protein F4822DRAFT_287248 [Hypoxylon trugodes]|uniref:uncharacterized protein n=1 Tax=Hypoxylon trugodes TaxID=326681 RepID=UPI00219FA227|nr:uncharacterized protein F4822DRAFT_287248 [Hypoxylon trugodes]KAI1387578.1 hypothetical protein F4822DRAFT_287248 [Hypoxylon trugodes]
MENNKPTLHYMANSGSQQCLWEIEELGIEYDLVLHERANGRAAAALKDTHPLGKAPQLVTADGRTIAERSAIAFYLIETYDKEERFKVPPAGTPGFDSSKNDRLREEQLLSLVTTSLNQHLCMKCVLRVFANAMPFFIRPFALGFNKILDKAFLDAEVDNIFKFLDNELEGRQYFNGTELPTRLDFVIQWYVDFGAQACSIDISKYPRVKSWFDTCTSRPAWKRALEQGNGYDLTF